MDTQKKVVTIPNVMSFFRIILIPLFIWLYCVKHDYIMTMLVLVLSGATDIVDGWIARHFHLISDLGKALDPIADKLTQAAILVCLLTEFPLMLIPLLVLVVKECVTAVTGLMVIRKTGQVYGARWYGKATTCLLYFTAIVHVVWHDIPDVMSGMLIFASTALLLLSFALYSIRNMSLIKEAQETDLSARSPLRES